MIAAITITLGWWIIPAILTLYFLYSIVLSFGDWDFFLVLPWGISAITISWLVYFAIGYWCK